VSPGVTESGAGYTENSSMGFTPRQTPALPYIAIIIIIIIFIYCNWVVTRWQWLFYMYTKYEIGY